MQVQVGLKCAILRTTELLPDSRLLTMLVTKFIADRADLVSSGGAVAAGMQVGHVALPKPPKVGHSPTNPRNMQYELLITQYDNNHDEISQGRRHSLKYEII